MAKKKSSPGKRSGLTQSAMEHKSFRLSREIVKLINEKAKLAIQQEKTSDAFTNCFSAVEESLTQLVEKNKGPVADEVLRRILTEIESATRSLVHKPRIAFLGPDLSYSHLAALQQFGNENELIAVHTIESVFEEVSRHHCEVGVVPLENSTDGRVSDTLEMFARLPTQICGEILFKVEHCLLANCARNQIREVYSKSQALSQCRNWLNRHLPDARLIDVASTSSAAKIAHDKDGAAAIASAPAAARYELQIVDQGIQDSKNNVTRFVVIGNETPKRTGKDKTALILVIEHSSGALSDVMSVFKRQNLNLTWIESYPTPGEEADFLFFIEFLGHQNDASVKKALDSIQKKSIRLELLGSYPKSMFVGQ